MVSESLKSMRLRTIDPRVSPDIAAVKTTKLMIPAAPAIPTLEVSPSNGGTDRS